MSAPYWQDDYLTIHGGDCREVMAAMPERSVHCVVTSPPYWGLRDYGTATWVGGDEACDHRIGRTMGNANKGAVREVLDGDRTACKCGAIRQDGQLGLEATPDAYVEAMVGVFREVRRVLRDDGTVWLNLGDSYSQGGYAGDDAPSNARRIAAGGADGSFHGAGREATRQGHRKPMQRTARDIGLKPKDLVGIPWRVAFALQADGWYLRSDIIWSKPNPMPESVTDRPTKAHEYLFLLSKKATYYYDADAVREAHTNPAGRNMRSVWTIATEPYPGAHFATFPRKLVEPCIKAGTSERGVCPECGAPWVRVTNRADLRDYPPIYRTDDEIERREIEEMDRDWKNGAADEQHSSRRMIESVRARRAAGGDHDNPFPATQTTGWRPSCAHDREPIGATVLDPFAGSGTTLLVAQALGRRAVGIDLNPDYLRQCLERNAQTPLGLGA